MDGVESEAEAFVLSERCALATPEGREILFFDSLESKPYGKTPQEKVYEARTETIMAAIRALEQQRGPGTEQHVAALKNIFLPVEKSALHWHVRSRSRVANAFLVLPPLCNTAVPNEFYDGGTFEPVQAYRGCDQKHLGRIVKVAMRGTKTRHFNDNSIRLHSPQFEHDLREATMTQAVVAIYLLARVRNLERDFVDALVAHFQTLKQGAARGRLGHVMRMPRNLIPSCATYPIPCCFHAMHWYTNGGIFLKPLFGTSEASQNLVCAVLFRACLSGKDDANDAVNDAVTDAPKGVADGRGDRSAKYRPRVKIFCAPRRTLRLKKYGCQCNGLDPHAAVTFPATEVYPAVSVCVACRIECGPVKAVPVVREDVDALVSEMDERFANGVYTTDDGVTA